MASPLLEVQRLSRSYGAVRAVHDLSFTLDRGQVMGFIGPNGAGKTTTMRILATLDLPDGGDALVEGRSVLVDPREVRKHVGFMADLFVPYANLNVLQFLDFAARAYDLRGAARVQAVRSVASFCGLLDFADRPASGLSKGMGQRLHLAKTLLHDPSLLILDEPTAGLDPRARIEFRDLLEALKAAGKGILISSHILSELSESCDAIVVIEKGKLVVSGDIDEIAKGLGPHREVVVKVLSDPDAALKWFLLQPGVIEPTLVQGDVRFRFDRDDEALAALFASAVGAALRICGFTTVANDLEDIFLRTTRGKLQ